MSRVFGYTDFPISVYPSRNDLFIREVSLDSLIPNFLNYRGKIEDYGDAKERSIIDY